MQLILCFYFFIDIGYRVIAKPKYFYIYDFNLWNNVSTASLGKRDTYEILEKMQNFGAGICVNKTRGLYHTDQYQLFEIFYNRARNDVARRTKDPSKASTFIIPYDFASDAAFFMNCPRNRTHICFNFRKCPLALLVEKLLLSSPWYQRNLGNDHLLLVGMNHAMDHYILKPKCKILLSGVCSNCTKLAIDDYSFLVGDHSDVKTKGDYWNAVPFPSDFHWTHEVERPYPWEIDDRPILVSYVGSTSSYYGPARKLRTSIVYYCNLHPNDCAHLNYGKNGTRSLEFIPEHDPHQLYQKSVFCFQPIGDLMTRKGLFDGLLFGCIPVTFTCLTASCMYTWHWSEDFWNKVSVEFDMKEVTQRTFDPVKALKEYAEKNPEEIQRKRSLIKQHVFELQYSLDHPTDKLASEKWPTSNGVKLKDAYDIAIDLVLEWHSGEVKRFRNASAPHCWSGTLNTTAVPSYCSSTSRGGHNK